MSYTIERNGFTSFQSWVQALSIDIRAAGFTVVNIDGTLTNDPVNTPITEKILFRANTSVDPVADIQPWSIALFFNEDEQYVDFYVCTPDQVINSAADFRIARRQVFTSFVQSSGKLTEQSYEFLGTGENRREFKTFSFKQWGIPNSDVEANPLSYRFVASPHGISLQVWVESYDSSGEKFAWFLVQRMIDPAGEPVITGKAPLFCLFSNKGYEDTGGQPDPLSIQKFVVRESDVNSPTIPVTALEDTADSSRIINGAQQVSIREGNTIVMFFPNDLNTQRYKYPYQLDMIGAISSDVLSQSSELSIPVFNEDTPRRYRGMNADREFNRGVRILFWVGGGSLE